MKRVLSTKLLDDSAEAYAVALNFELNCTEVIKTKGINFNINDAGNFNALVFTSANAVKFFFDRAGDVQLLKGKKIFSTSGNTAKALEQLGFTPAITAPDAATLAKAIIENKAGGPFLQPSGNLTLDILTEKLKSAGIKCNRLRVYETELLYPVLDLMNYDAIMFYSPSGITSFFAKNKPFATTVYCCIGETTAHALKQINKDFEIILPATPEPPAMLSALSLHFHNAAKYHE